MPDFNIHWKGYPQHRLPRIRVVSTRPNSHHSRSISVSGQSSKAHSKVKNEKENKKRLFRIQFRRQRVRSRASSSVVRARRRATVRAKHNIQVFGWDTPGAELASRVTEKTGSRYQTQERESKSGATLRPELQDDSGIPSTDGAASSVARRLNQPKKKSEKAYSLRHIAKVPVYWTADHPPTADKQSFNPDRLYSAQRSGPLQAASNRIPSHRPTEGTRPYDTRENPLSPITSQRPTASSRPQFKTNAFRRATSQVSPKGADPGAGSPEFWEAVRNFSQQSKLQGKSAASIKSAVQSLFSETASRSPSQKKVLARFTKGIELYLQVAKDHPSQSLISSLSTPSLTSVSAYTIQELKPYRSEFQSAGLAVTSDEQKGMAKLQKGSTPPPTPPKDSKYEQRRSSPTKRTSEAQKFAQKAKIPSYASGSTGTTVLGWTPPHEKTYGRPPQVERRRSSASTDHTIIGFTPPHEKYASPPKPAREAPAPPRASTKKSLPWLRKPDKSPESPPTTKLSVTSVQPEQQQHRPSTPLGGWVSTFDVIEPIEMKGKAQGTETSRPVVPNRPMQANKGDVKNSHRNSTATNYMNQMVNEMATQVNLDPFQNLEPMNPGDIYVHIGTQTAELIPFVTRKTTIQLDQAEEEQPGPDRAPALSSRSRTFPMKSNTCKGDCIQPSFEPFAPATQERSSRPSKITWKGVDQDIQASLVEPEYQSRIESIDSPEQLALQSNAVPGERTRTFPFATAPTRRIGPYQAPPQSRSPNKSLDDGRSRWAQGDDRPVNAAQRQSPPPLCTQCAGPLDPSTEPAAPFLEPELGIPAHACTARSSTQCQQCFPSRNSSIAILPHQVTSPIEVRAPVEVQYLPSRRSTRPIIPTGPYDYPEEPPSLEEVDPVFVDTPKGYHIPVRKRTQSRVELVVAETSKGYYTPERTWTQSKTGLADASKSYKSPDRTRAQSKAEVAIEEYTRLEPMADPMKRHSLPRLKLRPVKSDPPKHVHCYSTVSRPKALPPMPKVPAAETAPYNFASTASADSCSLKSTGVNEKKVFKGLHVATAAACDEDVDKWIAEITGSSAREFLSTLSAFDGLGVNTLSGVARRAAKQRKEKIDAWESLREKRVAEQDQKPRCEVEDDAEGEYMVGDQDVALHQKCSHRCCLDEPGNDEFMAYDQGVKKERDDLTRSMLKRRGCKGIEGARERAVRMGWRDRSVSGGT